jgi:hypothetical protein
LRNGRLTVRFPTDKFSRWPVVNLRREGRIVRRQINKHLFPLDYLFYKIHIQVVKGKESDFENEPDCEQAERSSALAKLDNNFNARLLLMEYDWSIIVSSKGVCYERNATSGPTPGNIVGSFPHVCCGDG